MKIGEIVRAKLIKAESFGIFLEFDGNSIFVQVVDRDWSRSAYDPIQFTESASEHDVLIRGYVQERDLYYGSIKDAHPELDPWKDMSLALINTKVSGVPTLNTDYGTFIELATGLKGLLHIDDGGGDLSIGKRIDVMVKKLDIERRRIEFASTET